MIQAQSMMHSLLLDGYKWSFNACTTASSGPQLSSKEKRCIQQGCGVAALRVRTCAAPAHPRARSPPRSIATYIEARSHIGQTSAQLSKNAGSDF